MYHYLPANSVLFHTVKRPLIWFWPNKLIWLLRFSMPIRLIQKNVQLPNAKLYLECFIWNEKGQGELIAETLRERTITFITRGEKLLPIWNAFMSRTQPPEQLRPLLPSQQSSLFIVVYINDYIPPLTLQPIYVRVCSKLNATIL